MQGFLFALYWSQSCIYLLIVLNELVGYWYLLWSPLKRMKLRFDPHCLVSWWHWRSSCEQQADLMLLHNAERGSDRLHKPVIGSCSHQGGGGRGGAPHSPAFSRSCWVFQEALALREPLQCNVTVVTVTFQQLCSYLLLRGRAAPGNQVGKTSWQSPRRPRGRQAQRCLSWM